MCIKNIHALIHRISGLDWSSVFFIVDLIETQINVPKVI